MKISKPLKITGIVFLSIVLIAVVGNFVLNSVIKNQLPKIIRERNDTAYDFAFDDISFSVFKNTLSVKNISLTLKKNANIKKDIDFFGKVEKIDVSGVNFYELLKNKNLKAFTISVIGPDITVLKPAIKDTLPTQSKLSSVIDIDKISVKKAHLKMMTTNNDTLLHEIHNFNAEINGIHMGEYTVKKDIPFTYTDYDFKIDSIYSLINDSQYASSHFIDVDKDHIEITNFRMLPHVSSKEFKNNETESNTRLYVDVPKLQLKNTDWGYDVSNELYVNIGAIVIDSINVKILDQKNKTVFQQAKKDAEKIIKPLIPFTLDINEVAINKSSFNSLQSLDIVNVNILIKGISNKISKQLSIKEFQLNNPVFTQIPVDKNKPKSSRSGKLNDVIIIDKVAVNNAKYILKDKTAKKNTLVVNNFNLSLNDIKVDDKTVLQNVPFTYSNPLLTTGLIHYDSNGDYKIDVANLSVKAHNASLNGFKMTPKMSRSQHAAKTKYAQDYYNLAAQSLNLNNFNWGFNSYNEFYINFAEVVLSNMDAQIYRDITNPLNPKKNELFSNKLRNLKFPFDIKVLRIKNSKLVYQEDSATSKNPGKLTFTNFNLTAHNIYSGYRKTTGAKTQITVNTKFMQQGDLSASWQFDILNRSENFNINGILKNFPAPAMNPFLKPYLNVAASGNIDKMAFNFSGNDQVANGDFAMNFDHLKMTLYNKDETERKFLSAAANMVLRSDTDGMKKTEVKQVERHKQKSFFNFLWLCIMQGLKQTVI